MPACLFSVACACLFLIFTAHSGLAAASRPESDGVVRPLASGRPQILKAQLFKPRLFKAAPGRAGCENALPLFKAGLDGDLHGTAFLPPAPDRENRTPDGRGPSAPAPLAFHPALCGPEPSARAPPA